MGLSFPPLHLWEKEKEHTYIPVGGNSNWTNNNKGDGTLKVNAMSRKILKLAFTYFVCMLSAAHIFPLVRNFAIKNWLTTLVFRETKNNQRDERPKDTCGRGPKLLMLFATFHISLSTSSRPQCDPFHLKFLLFFFTLLLISEQVEDRDIFPFRLFRQSISLDSS